MQPDDTAAMLEEAACEVLETMFFTAPLEEAAADAADTPRICATVFFRGPRSGRFTACLAEPAARELAETFLGAGDPPGITAVSEVVGEFANMVCGSVLGRLNPEALFGLLPASAGRCPGPHPAPVRRTLPLSGGSLDLLLED